MNSSVTIPVSIPVKPHVKAYLVHHFGDNYKLSLNDFLGLILFHLLKKQTFRRDQNLLQYNPKKFSEEYRIDISTDSFLKRKCGYITNETILHFNKTINKLIEFNFKLAVTQKLKEKVPTKREAIEQFMNENGINEHTMKYDSLKKSYWRFEKLGTDIVLSDV